MPYPRIHKFKPNPFQRDLIQSALRPRTRPELPLTIAETAVRTGKTGALAAWHRWQAKANPGVIGLIGVQSYKWYRRAMHQTCKELFGHEAKFHGTDFVWTFPGFSDAKLMIASGENINAIESVTAGWFSIDEGQDIPLEVFEVLLPRISDKRSRFPGGIICALPEFDSWPEQIALRHPDVKYFVDIPTDVNSENIMEGYAEGLAVGLSPAEYERKVKGKKPLPKGRVFRDLVLAYYLPKAPNQNGNLIQWEYDKDLPTYLGVDFGRRAAVTFRQKNPDAGFDVLFRELVPEDISTEAIARQILDIAVPRGRAKSGDKRIRIDRVTADPAGSSFEAATGLKSIEVLREVLGCDVAYTFDPKLRHIPYGIELINSRILNMAGQRRLLIDAEFYEKGLRVGPRGRSIVMSLLRSRYPEDKAGRPISEDPTKDGIDDHCRDALRYDIVNDYGMSKASSFSIR